MVCFLLADLLQFCMHRKFVYRVTATYLTAATTAVNNSKNNKSKHNSSNK